MPSSRLLNQINEVADQAAARADEYTGVFGSVKGAIIEAFGPNGLIAAYVLLTVMVLLLATKLAKITFSTLKFVVIPAVALAFLATLFIDVTFIVALPVSATICSLVLLFKG